jgi:pimeloyl-ACP methyl ester carboxylesterase
MKKRPRAAPLPEVPVFASSDSSAAAGADSSSPQPGAWQQYFFDRCEVRVPVSSPPSDDHEMLGGDANSGENRETKEDVFRVYSTGAGPAVFVLLHGGGHTALSWALCAQQLGQSYQVIAQDLRGHGGTVTSNDADLSSERLTQDIVSVVRGYFAAQGIPPERIPPILLAGHSLGGALAVRVAATRLLPVVGLCVVDVVEGTAMESLVFMRSIIQRRPTYFRSKEVRTHIRTQIHTHIHT